MNFTETPCNDVVLLSDVSPYFTDFDIWLGTYLKSLKEPGIKTSADISD